jgi:hypothetical protein
LALEDRLALGRQTMDVVRDELPQMGFAVHIEALAHPGELVRPMPCPFERIQFDLPAIEKCVHGSPLSRRCQVEPAMAQLSEPFHQFPAVLLRQVACVLRQGGQPLLQMRLGRRVIPVVLG